MVRIADLETGPYWKHMGMKAVAAPNGEMGVVMELSQNLKQFYGNIHGGAIAGLLDATIAVAIIKELNEGEGASTVELKLNYLRPASEGTMRGEGKCLKRGKKIAVGQGEIRDDAGQLVAFGTATFMITQLNR